MHRQLQGGACRGDCRGGWGRGYVLVTRGPNHQRGVGLPAGIFCSAPFVVTVMTRAKYIRNLGQPTIPSPPLVPPAADRETNHGAMPPPPPS